MIVMGKLIKKINPKEYDVIQWNTQQGIITMNIKVKIDLTSPELSVEKIVTWNYHMYDSTNGRYDMILGRYLLTYLGLNLQLSDHTIEADDGTFKGSRAPMVDMGTQEFKDLNTGKNSPGEQFTND